MVEVPWVVAVFGWTVAWVIMVSWALAAAVAFVPLTVMAYHFLSDATDRFCVWAMGPRDNDR